MKSHEAQIDNVKQSKVIWNSDTLAAALKTSVPEGIEIYSVSIDSRLVEQNSLFIGIKGEKLDGNDYAVEALEKGALLCIIDKEIKVPKHFQKQVIQVKSSFDALYQLAYYSRNRVKGKIIGITGSVGKTSTKEMINIALANQGEVYASYGNFNNHYGLPLCLANMPEDTDFGVFEMGMSAPGEIARLSKLCNPDVAVVTNVEPVHLEFFRSVAGIAAAKSEIYDGMREGGYAIINYDNPYHQILIKQAIAQKLRILGFACNAKVDFRLLNYTPFEGVSKIKTEIFGKDIDYTIGLIGKQHAINSLAVLAAVYTVGGEIPNAAYQLKYFKPQKRRGEIFTTKNNITIIDDSYNSSPAAVKYALENLATFRKSDNRLIVVLGDMRELGTKSPDFHKELLPNIIQAGVDSVYTVGELMRNLYNNLPANIKGAHTDASSEMAELIFHVARPQDIILVKGSLSIKMDIVVNKVKSNLN